MAKRRQFTLYVNPHPKPAPLISDQALDLLNSVCWLLMDALWMFNLPKVGVCLGLFALVSGCFLFKQEKQLSSFWNQLATQAWIMMNLFWLLSDTYPAHEHALLQAAKTCLMLGILCVCRAVQKGGKIAEILAHYKRYKTLGRKNIASVKP